MTQLPTAAKEKAAVQHNFTYPKTAAFDFSEAAVFISTGITQENDAESENNHQARSPIKKERASFRIKNYYN